MLFKKDKYYYTPNARGIVDPDFLELISYKKYIDNNMCVVLGYDEYNEPIFLDIKKAPHILVAGATGSGKSVCINTIILELILKNNPNDLEMYLIDPKKVDYIKYSGLKHIKGYADDLDDTTAILQNIHDVMVSRYTILQAQKRDNIEGLKMPCMLVIFDEYASLSTLKGALPMIRLLENILRLGRAVGIHVILGTQNPDSKVITSQIKSNVPTSIAFRTKTRNHSRIVLDVNGAELLRGNGDGVIMQSNGDFEHFQGYMVSDRQKDYLLDFWKGQPYNKRQLKKLNLI